MMANNFPDFSVPLSYFPIRPLYGHLSLLEGICAFVCLLASVFGYLCVSVG